MALKIMLVEYDRNALNSVKAILEYLDSEVQTFGDIHAAGEGVRSHSFDWIFLGIQPPQAEWLDFIKLVRSTPSNGKVPVVMMTDENDSQAMRLGFRTGASYFLRKPLDIESVHKLYISVRSPILVRRRNTVRLAYQTCVKCSSGPESEKQFEARSLEIGEGGMGIELSINLEAGQLLSIEFSLPSLGQPLKMSASVLSEGVPNRYGLNFIRPSVSDREAIRAFVQGGSAANPSQAIGGPRARHDMEELIRQGLQEAESEREKSIRSASQRAASLKRKSVSKRIAYIVGGLLVSCLVYETIVRSPQASRKSPPVTQLACIVQSAPPTELPFLSLAPAVIEAPSKPGQAVTYTLNLTNQSRQALSFNMIAKDMEQHAGRLMELLPSESPNGVATRAVLSRKSLLVNPSQTASVDVTLTPPIESRVRFVLVTWSGTDKIRTWNGRMVLASPSTMITFEIPHASENPQAASQERDSMTGYTVCQWRP